MTSIARSFARTSGPGTGIGGAPPSRRPDREGASGRHDDRWLGVLALSMMSIVFIGIGALAAYGAIEQLGWQHARAVVANVEGSEFPVLRFRDAREQWWEVPARPSDAPDRVVNIRYRESDPRDVLRNGPWTIAVPCLIVSMVCVALGSFPMWVLKNELSSIRRERRWPRIDSSTGRP
jgi:hypothetical protein